MLNSIKMALLPRVLRILYTMKQITYVNHSRVILLYRMKISTNPQIIMDYSDRTLRQVLMSNMVAYHLVFKKIRIYSFIKAPLGSQNVIVEYYLGMMSNKSTINIRQMAYDYPILTKQGSSFQNQIIVPVDQENKEIQEINQFFSEQFPQSTQDIVETPKLSEKTEEKKELKINKLIQKQSKDLDVQEPCYCSKTGCLKRYCRCFHSGRMCTKQCECEGCLNDDKLLFERNNAIKYVQKYCHRDKKIPKAELFSLKKSYGCYCKKSNCRKNYCECYIRGQPCTEYCECHNCDNCDNCDKSMLNKSEDLEVQIQNDNRKRIMKRINQSSQP